ncbi:MAG: type I-U CRISPR-associated protein Csx17, partial [Magnetococcales bacterium]|nr:type I-U CRISPR-associated protein Csx17 [Magnetococcales bacterium]
MTHTLTLAGCAPVPLSHYLKALGILRLVAEQVDENAQGWWQGQHFVLKSTLDRQGLCQFFLEDYVPTPVIAPWNGGSGFYPKDNKDAHEALLKSTTSRFALLREVITLGQKQVAAFGLQESCKDLDEKRVFLQAMRASLPDQALMWLDAAVLLTNEKAKFPPLLGTGGNDGRLDFSNNFLQRVVELLSPSTGKATVAGEQFLANALFGEPVARLGSGAIGQFAPGDVGGPNATNGFEGETIANAWDYLLMIEGAMTFAAAASRRLHGSEEAVLAYPFTVRPTGYGSGQTTLVDEEPARAEIWLPLWNNPTGYDELRALFAEGRATVGKRSCKDGLDFARAIASLGVDRGIEAFQRYGFLMRSGKAYLATPLMRMKVQRNPAADLIQELDQQGWLSRLQRLARDKDKPNRLKWLVGQLQDALFTLTKQGNPDALQNILIALGGVHHYLTHAPKAREELPPVPRLSKQWFAADDNSHEFRIAAALATLHAPGMAMRHHLFPFDGK